MKVAAVTALVALALPAGALAATDQISTSGGNAYPGGGGPAGEYRLDAGTRAQLVNADPAAEHNVVATADGPDGRELFQSDLIGLGTTAVAGTEYLTAGPYPFVCTIHDGMAGTLLVEGDGALPRPSVTVAVASSKLEKVREGKLKVTVTAATASSDVSLIARVGTRTLPQVDGIDVGVGRTRKLTIRLDRSATKPLKDAKRAKVTLSASVPFGSPAKAKRTLR